MTKFDLDLDALGLNIAGAPPKPLVIEEVTELEASELAVLVTNRDTSAPKLKKLRERHHALAKMLASGVSEGDAAIACGYSNSRISILKSDPSFQELLNFYGDKAKERFYDVNESLGALSRDAVEEIRERLEEEPESFTVGQLESLAKLALDRTGHGPSTKTEVNVKVGMADRLEAARLRAQERRKMIDITPESPADE